MTTPTSPGHGQTLTAPELISLPPVAGGQSDVFGDVLRAGLDPAAAFGAAFGLNRTIGHDPVNNALQRWSAKQAPPTDGGPTPPATGATPEAGKPQPALNESASTASDPKTAGQQPKLSVVRDGDAPSSGPRPTAPASAGADAADNAAGKAIAQDAKRSLAKVFADSGARAAAREGGVLAAKRGAALATRTAASAMLRLGALSVPGLGVALTAAMWIFDTDGRKAFNNLIASLSDSAAPAIDAAPSPPRTYFLPLTNDGNRDGIIEQTDHGMSATNAAAFGYHPDDVWPTANPNIATTSDFAAVATKFNAFNAKMSQVLEGVPAAYQTHADQQYVAAAWANTKPGIDALTEFQTTQLQSIGTQLMAGATSANNAYQGFRAVNLKNRQEINNSTSGLIPFWANHVNQNNMSDSTAEIKNAVNDMEKVAQALATSADTLDIKSNRPGMPVLPSNSGSPRSMDLPAPAEATPAAATGVTPMAPPAAATPADTAKDLASMLRGMPGGMPMPTMPGFPQIPSIPSIPGLGGGMPPAAPQTPAPVDPPAEEAPPLDAQKDVNLDAPQAPGDPAVATPLPGPAAAAKTVAATTTDPAAPQGPPASNTTDIGGRKWTFDNPKLAQLAHNLTGTDGSGHKSVQQAATEAGFTLPPPGQDIGEPIPTSQIKPGDLIMGANNNNGVFLGVVDGQAMAINEAGEVKPLDQVANFDGAHQGFFRLADDGTPTGETPSPIQTVDATTASPDTPPVTLNAAPAPAPITTDATNTGVAPAQTTGTPGLNPTNVPTNN